ncbi:MAG: protein kinase [Gemmataceae bacterium]
MSDPSIDTLEFDSVAAEFARRVRTGEKATISDYMGRYPQFADMIRDLFPTIALVEEPNRERHRAFVPLPERIGEYRIVGILGRGGMGIVYEAEQESLGRRVALKVLAPEWANHPASRDRFLREARAAAAISHPNVVATYTVGDHDGRPFLTQEIIRGESLAQRIARDGPLDMECLLRVGGQVARGLAAAHARGLIHRDVKPANVLLEVDTGRVLLTDFGLARALDEPHLTRTGDVAGTPQYMSPEQAQGRPTDHRTDLFSLGSLLTALATGKPPFRGESGVAVLRCVCDDAPTPLDSSTPPWLAAVVAKLMAKAPADRFATADEVGDVLERGLEHVKHPDRVSPPAVPGVAALAPRSRWWLIAIAVLATIVVFAAWPRHEPVKAPADAAEALTSPNWEWTTPESLGPVVNSTHDEMNPFVTADGLTLLFASNRPGGQGDKDLWESRRSSPDAPWGEPVNLGPDVNGPDGDDAPCMSGDGLILVFASQRPGTGATDIFECRRSSRDALWSKATSLGPAVNSRTYEFRPWLSPDGCTLTFSSMRPPANGVWVCRRQTPQEPFGPAEPFGSDSHRRAVAGLSFTADGRVLLCNRLNAILPGDLLWLGRIDSPDEPFRNLQSFGPTVNTDAIDTAPVASSDGRIVYFQSDRRGGYGGSDLWLTRRVPKKR